MVVKFGILTAAPGGMSNQLESDVNGNLKVAGTTNSFTSKSVTVGLTAAQISPLSYQAIYGVQLRSASSNTGKIYIGNSLSVTALTAPATDGFVLTAGDGLFLPLSNVNLIYAISDTAAQILFFLVI